MKNAFDLSGQVAIITGSSRGIGRSIAETMAAQGAKVVVSSRKAEACEEVAEAIRRPRGEADRHPVQHLAQGGGRGAGRRARSRSGAASTRWCATPRSIPTSGRSAGISDDAFDKIMATNVKSNLWLCNLAIPEMAETWRRQRHHRLVDRRPARQRHARRLRHLEGGGLRSWRAISPSSGDRKNVRVNCIAPGLVKTDFARALWEDEKRLKARLETTPLRRIGEPDDIGGIAAFLASHAAAFMTGADHRRRRRRHDWVSS